MGSLFGRRKEEKKTASVGQPALEQISYGAAYSLLPHYLYADEVGGTLKLFIDAPRVAGIKLLVGASILAEYEPDEQMMNRFSETKGHSGQLSPGIQYRIVEYPPPASADLGDLGQLDELPPEQLMQKLSSVVLAPYFSILLLNNDLKLLEYLILGQSPNGETTLRLVEQDAHSNLGPGCVPELEALLAFLKQRQSKSC